MNEEEYLIADKNLKPYFKKIFEKNRSNIDKLEKVYDQLSLKNLTKENPILIFTYIGSLGLSPLLLYILIKLDKKEFNEQLKIWKSFNN